MASLSYGAMVNYYKQECAAYRALVNRIPLDFCLPQNCSENQLRSDLKTTCHCPPPLPWPSLSLTSGCSPGAWGTVPVWSTEIHPSSQWDPWALSSHWHPANRWPPAALPGSPPAGAKAQHEFQNRHQWYPPKIPLFSPHETHDFPMVQVRGIPIAFPGKLIKNALQLSIHHKNDAGNRGLRDGGSLAPGKESCLMMHMDSLLQSLCHLVLRETICNR